MRAQIAASQRRNGGGAANAMLEGCAVVDSSRGEGVATLRDAELAAIDFVLAGDMVGYDDCFGEGGAITSGKDETEMNADADADAVDDAVDDAVADADADAVAVTLMGDASIPS